MSTIGHEQAVAESSESSHAMPLAHSVSLQGLLECLVLYAG